MQATQGGSVFRLAAAEVLSLPRRVQRPERDANWDTDELPAVAELPQLAAMSTATPVWKQA